MKIRRRGPRAAHSTIASGTSSFTVTRTLEQQIEDIVSQVAPRRHPDGEIRRVVSTLIVRITDFPAVCEEVEPPEVGAILEVYMQTVADAVGTFLGSVHRAMGDVVMATWNAEYPQPDHAVLAVNAAIDMMERIDDVNWRLRTAALPEISYRIGVNTGDALVKQTGLLGGNGDVVGDSVNVAFLLAAIADGRCILIGEGTRVSTGDQILAGKTDIDRLPGKNQPVRAFRVLGRMTTL